MKLSPEELALLEAKTVAGSVATPAVAPSGLGGGAIAIGALLEYRRQRLTRR